jgi:hypothetical protein
MLNKADENALGLWVLTVLLLTTAIITFGQQSERPLIQAAEVDHIVVFSCPSGTTGAFGNREVGRGIDFGCFDARGDKVPEGAANLNACRNTVCE